MTQRNRKNIKANAGFTLLEAAMAMVILAVAASGIFLSFATAGTLQDEANRRVLASRLAADMIETIRAEDRDQIEISYPAGYSQTALDMGNTGDIYTNYQCVVVANNPVEVSVGGNTVELLTVTVATRYQGKEITRVTTLIGDEIRQ